MSGQVITETDIAAAIADGTLPSPQKVGNSWLFALRITGTGVAYRLGQDEHVFRDPDLYLNDRFLQRCNGLPVTLGHPASNSLTSDEAAERVIGAVVRPFLKADEVWGVARIFDDDVAQAMRILDLSTSPCVVLNPASNTTLEIGTETFLIEGEAALLDHIAIVANGVWDKAAGPSGIQRDEGVTNMADEPDKKTDDPMTAILDAIGLIGKRIDGLCARMDGMDKVVADGMVARRDAMAAPAAPMLRDPSAGQTAAARVQSDAALRNSMAHAQERADSVANAHGREAPRPLDGETLIAYRRRLLQPFQVFSPEFKNANLSSVSDASVMDGIETKIYADAMIAARDPVVPEGTLHERVTTDDSGRRIKTFYGSPRAWMAQFRNEPRVVKRVNTANFDYRND